MTEGASTDQKDEELRETLERARRGDRIALEQLLERTAGPVFDFLRRRFGDGSLRGREEDAAIETLLRVVQHVDSCQASTPRAYWKWVLTIARNEGLRLARGSYLTRSSVLTPAILDALQETEVENETSAIAPLLPLLKQAIEGISAERQELLGLRYVERLEYAEIAEIIETTAAAAKRRVQRLHSRLHRDLRRAVEAYDGPDKTRVRAAFRRLNRAR